MYTEDAVPWRVALPLQASQSKVFFSFLLLYFYGTFLYNTSDDLAAIDYLSYDSFLGFHASIF